MKTMKLTESHSLLFAELEISIENLPNMLLLEPETLLNKMKVIYQYSVNNQIIVIYFRRKKVEFFG